MAMLRHAQADGIEAVVVTPHACSAQCTAKGFDVLRRGWEEWQKNLAGSGIKMKTYSGAEVYFTSELLPILRDQRDLLTINNGSYVLLEFPHDYVYAHSKEYIFKILTEGFIPIISHAERNAEIQRSPGLLGELVKAGALCQINAGSLRGDFGNAARQSAFELISGNLVHIIASDAHDMASRKPELSYVRALLHGVDPAKVDLLLHGIPEAVIADQAVPDIGEPSERAQRGIFFDLFKKRGS